MHFQQNFNDTKNDSCDSCDSLGNLDTMSVLLAIAAKLAFFNDKYLPRLAEFIRRNISATYPNLDILWLNFDVNNSLSLR